MVTSQVLWVFLGIARCDGNPTINRVFTVVFLVLCEGFSVDAFFLLMDGC